MQFHIDQQTEKNRRAGMRTAEARRQARLRFGGVARVPEETRDEIRPALSRIDARHPVRQAGPPARAWLHGAALATLAIGIGATAAIFSVVRR